MRARRGGRFGITEGAGRERGGSVQRVSAESGGVWRFGWAWAGRPAKAALKRCTPGTLARVFEEGVGGARAGWKM